MFWSYEKSSRRSARSHSHRLYSDIDAVADENKPSHAGSEGIDSPPASASEIDVSDKLLQSEISLEISGGLGFPVAGLLTHLLNDFIKLYYNLWTKSHKRIKK